MADEPTSAATAPPCVGDAPDPVTGSGAPPPALAVEGVSVRFGGIRALTDVSLAVPAGQVCGLIGSNGAGKTTLFDVLSGVRAANAGTVRLRGADVTRRSAVWRSRHGLRRTFQRQQTFGWLSVEDNVLVALESRGGGGGLVADLVRYRGRRRLEQQRRGRVAEVLELCGLRDDTHVAAGTLPVGRARTLELARAIVDPPDVLLLDEATSGLEAAEVTGLGATVERVRAAHGCAVLLVEHDVGFVMARCERVVALHLGAVLADGTPDEVRTDPAVQAAYLGTGA